MSTRPRRLHHYSGRGTRRDWVGAKLKSQALSNAYRALDAKTHGKRADRVAECANRLEFERVDGQLELRRAFRCKNRLCAVCAALNSRKDFAILMSRMAEHANRHPFAAPILVTLSMPNVTPDNLKAGITHLLGAYRRLLRMPVIKRAVMGSHRSLEITVNKQREDFHPHLHCIMQVGPDAGRAPHISIIERYQDLPKLITTLGEILAQRIAVAKAQGLAKHPGKPILVIVDEFAQIMLEPDTKPGREAITDGFVRLGNQARAANIVLWVQVQHAVAETLPTALRRNLNTVISFRQPSGQAAANIFGDTGDFPVDITRLARGQCLFRHGLTSEITALQAANVGLADIPTLLKGDADAPHP